MPRHRTSSITSPHWHGNKYLLTSLLLFTLLLFVHFHTNSNFYLKRKIYDDDDAFTTSKKKLSNFIYRRFFHSHSRCRFVRQMTQKRDYDSKNTCKQVVKCDLIGIYFVIHLNTNQKIQFAGKRFVSAECDLKLEEIEKYL